MRIFALVALLLAGCATVDTTLPNQLVQVHDFPGKTKQQICGAARDWVALNFKDSKAVVEVYDLERGKLIGKGTTTVSGFAAIPTRIGFTMTADCKDGKLRSTWSDFTQTYQGATYPLRAESISKLFSKSIEEAKAMDAAMAKHIATPNSDF